MTESLIIRDAIRDMIAPICAAYQSTAPDSVDYPYAVYEARKIGDGAIDLYAIEINVWDKNRTYSRSQTLADEIEDRLKNEYVTVDDVLMVIYANTKQPVEDPDKQIKRVRLLMEAQILT